MLAGKKVIFLLTVVIGLFVFSFAIVSSQVVKPILIGATVSLEGKYRMPSHMVEMAYRLWEKEVNSNGGLLGRPVKLILKNDRSSPEFTRKLYEELINKDQVDLVLAPYGSPLTMIASEVSEKHRKLMIACSASSEKLWQRGFQYLIGMYATADRYFIGFLDLIARYGLNSVAIIFEDSTFTKDAANGALKWAHRFHLNVVLAASYKSRDSFFSSIIENLKKIHPDALLLSVYPNDAYRFLKEMELKSFNVKALCITIAPVFPDFCRKVGNMCEGIFAPAQWVPNERIPFPGSKAFISNFKKFAGITPTYHAASCYSACKILEEAIQKTKTLDQDVLLRYVLGLNTVSIIGRFRVSHLGRQMGHNPVTIQWQSGKQEIVYPISLQTALPRFRSVNSD